MPPDASTDEEQLERLLGVFTGGNGLITSKGKKPGQTLVTGQINVNGNGLKAEGEGEGEGQNGLENIAWRVYNRDCWFIPETGEIFTDYE